MAKLKNFSIYQAKINYMELRDRVKEIYDFVDENLYYNIRDIEIKGKRFNSTLLFSILTCCLPGKQLVVGEPGMGKTTSSEHLACLFYSLPLELIWSSVVHGNPEQTEEKIVGRPDLGKLNEGKEEVIWSAFAQLPVKIVDEINRLPPSKQDLLLDSVDRGIWSYLNEVIINEENCFFATANYTETTGFELTPRMLDRFDIIVESKHPGAILSYEVIESREIEKKLRNPTLARRAIEILNSKLEYENKMSKIEEISNEYSDLINEKLGISPIKKKERIKLREEIYKLEMDKDAEAFSIVLLAELSFCRRYGQKRTNEECLKGCHYSEYLCYRLKSCISNRFPQSLISYSKALAWFLGDSQADIEHVITIAPYALAHRLRWREDYYMGILKDERSDFIELYLAKLCVNEVLKRYREQSSRIKLAFKQAAEALEGNKNELLSGDHPVYEEIRRVVENY